MPAQLAEQPLELPASAEIYRLPPKVDAPNPIIEAEPEAYQPPPDAVLNRPKAKRQRKAKSPSGKRPGRPKNPAPQVEAPVATAQPFVATPPHGDAKPNRWFSKLELGDRIWMVCAGVIVGVALSACGYFIWTGVGQ